nr:hypothetical protein [uncultured Dubosiella sp.]
MTLQDEIIDAIQNNELDDAFHKIQEYEQSYGHDDFYYLSLSDLLLFQGMYEDVLILMEDAKNNGYDDELFYERRADALIGLDRFDDALDYLKMCTLGEDPEEDLHILYLYGQVYLNKEDYKMAVQYFEDILLEVDTPSIYCYAAIAYWKLGKKARSLEYFERAKDDEESLTQICLFLKEEKEEKSFFDFVQCIPEEDYRIHLISDYYLETEAYEQAVSYLEEKIEAHPLMIFYVKLLGLFEQLNQPDKMKHYERKILRLPIDDTMTRINAIEMKLIALQRLHYRDETIKKYIKEFMTMSGNDKHVFFAIASFLMNGRYIKVASKFLYAYEFVGLTKEEKAYLTRIRIFTALSLSDFYKAYDEFQALKQYQTIDEEFMYDYAVACFNSHHVNEALEIARQRYQDGRMAALCIAGYDLTEQFDEQAELLGDIHKLLDAGYEYPNIDAIYDVLGTLANE